MKPLFALAIAAALLITACSGKPPQARVMNTGRDSTSVQFKAQGGNTVNINGVAPGTASPAAEISKGGNTVTSDTKAVKDTDAITAATSKLYTAVVDSVGKMTVQEGNQ